MLNKTPADHSSDLYRTITKNSVESLKLSWLLIIKRASSISFLREIYGRLSNIMETLEFGIRGFEGKEHRFWYVIHAM